MILALNKHDALCVFSSLQEAESYLEAVDVQQEAIEFCDERGLRYSPVYTILPHVARFGPLTTIEIGMFRLRAEPAINAELPGTFLQRAAVLEYSSIRTVNGLESARRLLGDEMVR
jgi:hypothetical protein